MSLTTQQLKNAFDTWQTEDSAFTEKGNKSAGTRARKALLEIGKLTKTRRSEISAEKSGE